jgi:hypothetical protein
MSQIKMLNGEIWEQASLVNEMHDDEFYYGYLGVNALSSSACKMLMDSPKSYYYTQKYGQKDSNAFNVGRIVHMMALEPHKVEETYEVIPIKSRATKTFQEAISHLTKITITEFSEAERLANALLRNGQVSTLMRGCEFEVPMIGMHEGLPFRSKADMYNPLSNAILDLKTTTNLKAFKISAHKYSYDLQCYLYCTLFNSPWQEFKFIAIDKQSLDIGVYEVSESFYLRGKAKLQRAIEMYRIFFIEKEDLDSYTIRETLE